jgi:LysR family transcriptional regulator, hypochlorite-specific transcription factor HypT
MELRWLEDFLALAEQRTFARAAAVRRVTQPAFGRRIRALEEWVGTRLFVRSAQGAVLTPAGKFLRAPAEELTRHVYQLRQATLEVADREASTLSVAATHALSFMFFPSWIRNHVLFGTLGPVNLISDTLDACEDIMLRGEADVMLCHYHQDAGTRLEPSHFTSVVVGGDVLLPLSAPGSKGAPQWTLPGHPESPVPFLSYGPKSGLGRILDAVWAKERGAVSMQKRFTAQLATALLSMTRQGQGVAWIPQTLAAEDIEAGRVVDAGLGRFAVDVEIRLFRPVHGQTRTAAAFWKAITDGSCINDLSV